MWGRVCLSGAVALSVALTVTLSGAWSSAGPRETAHRAALSADAITAEDPTALVDPMVGTGNGGRWVGQVDTFPGVTAPFGMVQWSPDTVSRPDGGGYNYADSALTGFSLTHLSGPGCPIAGDFPFLPVAGTVPAVPEHATASFGHDTELARPGYYAVTAGRVRTELSATARTGVARFSYPPGAAAQLLINAAGSATRSSGARLRISGDREVTGQVTSGHFCGAPSSYTVYFAARFDRPLREARLWPGAHGATLTFDTRHDPSVRVQVGLSYVSTQGAESNLAAEAHSWDVGQVAAQERAGWRRQLNAIQVTGGSRTQRATFYTALYHSLLHPSVFSDADGRYPGFDGRIHRTDPAHPQYADFSGWDIYRCQIPLLATIAPGAADDMATSLLNDADQGGGWLPRWPVANAHTSVMNGDPADGILAGIYAFGDHRFDARRALRLMVHGAEDTRGRPGQGFYVERPWAGEYLARGYVPNIHQDSTAHVRNGASTTLEYADADYAVAGLADALGDTATAHRFRARSHNWAHLFDRRTGWIRPRDGHGAFPAGPAVDTHDGQDQDGFQEGNTAQYTWMVPQDLPALIDAVGGRDAANARLDTYFTRLNAGNGEPYHWQGNEVAFGTPWIYDSTGRPARTQAVVGAIMDQLYGLRPGGEPGNDDLGAMSSWYVWAALGLYPQTPGAPRLVLSTPLFPHAVVHRPGRADLTVSTSGTGGYISALTRDGRPSTATWTAATADRLDLTLTGSPDTPWGTGPADAPPALP
ncbi:GH92 family glycosyl hydrolase [Streptacidiphilus sp. EB129]|uniref:GH92 family glycosyl hydrolase n=1 Tax=Streptacidiphilus sp. EB129 TaxID=3156262 RepID=UPI003511D775